MVNRFLMSTWWFTLPYTVRVRTSGGTKSLDVMKFLSSDYMYSESQMDVAVFASMLNINIHIFQYNRVKGVRRLDTGKYKNSNF